MDSPDFIPNIWRFSQNIFLLLAREPLPILARGQTTSDRALKQALEQVGHVCPLQT
jgi:hypothetical protein